MDELLIENRKKYSELKKRSIALANSCKDMKCKICGSLVEGYCSSHSVPRFVLERIAIDGHVLRFTNFAEKNSFEKDIIGVSCAGIFRNICRKCDSKFFSEYEDEDKLLSIPLRQSTMKAIAIKCLLCSWDVWLNEGSTLKTISDKMGNDFVTDSFYNVQLATSECNLSEDERDLKELVDNFCSDSISFKIIYYRVLDYVAPMACQIVSCLQFDLEGQFTGNDMSNEKNEIVYIAVLPVKNKTLVTMFMDSRNKKYDKFNMQFEKLDEKRKLAVINYIIFLTSDKVFMSPNLEKLRRNKNFKYVFGHHGLEFLRDISDSYMNLAHMVNIPNVLTMKVKT